MRIKQAGNLGDKVIIVVKSAEASATIPRGTPVVAVLNGTNDGLAVVLPSTAGAAKNYGFKLGVATEAMAPGDVSNAIAFGYVAYALITRATRATATTTDSWSSSSSVASGICLGIDSLNNAFLMGASSDGSLPSVAAAVLVDSISSIAASATNTTDTRTAITVGARVFVRML